MACPKGLKLGLIIRLVVFIRTRRALLHLTSSLHGLALASDSRLRPRWGIADES